MRYNAVKKKHYYGEHYGSVCTGFIIGLDKSQETVNHLLLRPPPPPPSLRRSYFLSSPPLPMALACSNLNLCSTTICLIMFAHSWDNGPFFPGSIFQKGGVGHNSE